MPGRSHHRGVAAAALALTRAAAPRTRAADAPTAAATTGAQAPAGGRIAADARGKLRDIGWFTDRDLNQIPDDRREVVRRARPNP